MAEFELRAARAEDSSAIRDLVRQARLNPIGLDWQRFIVAVTGKGEIVGCGQIKTHIDRSSELASLTVVDSYRGRGVGRAIITRLLNENSRPLYLMCRSQMEALYRKFGFHPIPIEAMPPYFRRVVRFVYLAKIFIRAKDALLVMRLD